MRAKTLIKSALYPLYEKRLLAKLDLSKTPRHIGVILDGNRRWAKENPSFDGDTSSAHGHKAGANKIIELLTWSEQTEISLVTLWLLSSDNLKRSPQELESLMEIIGSSVEALGRTGRWSIKVLGSLELLPEKLQERLKRTEAQSAGIPGLKVNVAIGYGGRLEIVDAVKKYLSSASGLGKGINQIADELTVNSLDQYLYTAGQPDPELVIRTSGEQRLGGFLLWQSHQSEFYFCEAYWPDFRRVDFLRALRSYSMRQRRLGK
ncbi:MAG: di-trans,poly-cis-decaprenylcistransferase [Actinobacteria bacterium]|nr:di-trans,poly-cis-decaprenylcistransferase [Actinomycetota bacterium]